jgi:hypothetical protein
MSLELRNILLQIMRGSKAYRNTYDKEYNIVLFVGFLVKDDQNRENIKILIDSIQRLHKYNAIKTQYKTDFRTFKPIDEILPSRSLLQTPERNANRVLRRTDLSQQDRAFLAETEKSPDEQQLKNTPNKLKQKINEAERDILMYVINHKDKRQYPVVQMTKDLIALIKQQPQIIVNEVQIGGLMAQRAEMNQEIAGLRAANRRLYQQASFY